MSGFKHTWAVHLDHNLTHQSITRLASTNIDTDEHIALSMSEFNEQSGSPIPNDNDTLIICYNATELVNFYRAHDWVIPDHIIELHVEFRNLTNGLALPSGNNLTGALIYFGLDHLKLSVKSIIQLYQKMNRDIDLGRALLRGQYMASVAIIENNGIPIDIETWTKLNQQWDDLRHKIINTVDQQYNVFNGLSFNTDRFKAYLLRHDITWQYFESGQLDLKDDTFKDMAKSYPQLQNLREAKVTLSKLRPQKLAVGLDGRNRSSLVPFRSITGRNQPSTNAFIFGPAVWVRGLIKPSEGYGLAYVDWSQQEFGIAAALSKDELMMAAYSTGDPYLAFAKQAGAVPNNATKVTHKKERERFKACVLAVQYGMGARSLALRINQSVDQAQRLLDLHKQTYKQFWQWSDASLDHAMLYSKLQTVFGWTLHVTPESNPRSVRNFPMQANGAEMLRYAINSLVKADIKVCAPVHDAVLIEAPLDELDAAVVTTQQLMSDASAMILDGFRLKSDVYTVRYPDRYMDDRGAEMWNTVMELLDD